MIVHIVSDIGDFLCFVFFATWFRQINIFRAKQILFSHLEKVASSSANPEVAKKEELDSYWAV